MYVFLSSSIRKILCLMLIFSEAAIRLSIWEDVIAAIMQRFITPCEL